MQQKSPSKVMQLLNDFELIFVRKRVEVFKRQKKYNK